MSNNNNKKNFFDRFKPPKGGTNNNPLSGLFGGTASFSGQGKSLGGSQPGQILPITLTQPGSLGIQLEKKKQGATNNSTAIVAHVVANSQAAQAGLQRGDVLCFAGSNGQEEIFYEMFLELAASQQRPLHFEVRRMVVSSAATQAATSGSAADFARRQAVIAAAEKRDREHKKKLKPIPKVSKDSLPKLLSTAEKQKLEQERKDRIEKEKQKPMSLATQQALQQAKTAEAKTAAQLGYNPYQVKNMTAGQARNAVTATTHGTIQADGDGPSSLPTVSAPPPMAAADDGTTPPPPPSFQQAFETVVTSGGADHDQVVASFTILEKLLHNATTKSDAKFRKVRLGNPKINAAVAQVPGAIDVLLATGFVLTTEDGGDSVLVYDCATPPQWVPTAIAQMERYRQGGGSF